VSFSIRCEEAEEDRYILRFSVEDTGIGIQPESMERLFEPFFQADASNTRKYGGTGLGLSICSALLQMMGSELKVESVPGEGSRFFFDLRGERVMVLEPAEEEAVRTVPEEPFMPATRPTILIIEDEELNRRLLRLLLSKLLDADIVEAEGGEEGAERFRERAPDLIFLDLQMPGRDGHWTARKIRELEGAGRHTALVAFTADVQPATREACFASGMDDYICKPADLYTLREVLERHLQPKA
jgi:CheY-like chemotaxis protein